MSGQETINPPSTDSEKLGEWHATAICGNDITSSCLYVSALALVWAGPLAPISLLLVAFVLWLFRGIYAEVVEALPLNGGAYNALLNTTSKFRASVAACLTILSYLATAVISASEATHYLAHLTGQLFGYHPSYPEIIGATIMLLCTFAVLTIRGIGESARVALCIFVFHLTTLSVLLITGALWLFTHGTDTFLANMTLAPPRLSAAPLFFGFCVAMLGISGFESSANFVEEQKPGVFRKTLRNMWLAVSFFNPMICLLALALVPLPAVEQHQEALLAHMGGVSGGSWLEFAISLDAAIVLSGAVLTSFIGTTGLVQRMTLDRCLPQSLLKTGQFGTFYRIILLFLILCSGLLILVHGNISTLAGVYTISFLSVMALFVVGNVLLKIKRDRLPREVRVNWITLIVAFAAVVLGIVGNVISEIEYLTVFSIYFFPTILIVFIMLWRINLLRIGIYSVSSATEYIGNLNNALTEVMKRMIDAINSQTVVFFTRGDNIANLNEAMLYVRKNEHTNKVKVVVVVQDANQVPATLKPDLEFLDQAYPEIDIQFVVEKGDFGPELLQQLSRKWAIPLNFMFIGSPGDRFPFRLAELGGVRLIIS